MKGILGIDQHRVDCIIGIHPEERIKEQPIYIDLKVETDFSKCKETDDLSHAVDYESLAALCTGIAKNGRYNLMESYACAVLESILSSFDVSWAWIKVRKPQTWGDNTCTVVELERYPHAR